MPKTIEEARKNAGTRMMDLVARIETTARDWEESKADTDRDFSKEFNLLMRDYTTQETNCEILKVFTRYTKERVRMAVGSLNRRGLTKRGEYQIN